MKSGRSSSAKSCFEKLQFVKTFNLPHSKLLSHHSLKKTKQHRQVPEFYLFNNKKLN